jgi:hypothetical protein
MRTKKFALYARGADGLCTEATCSDCGNQTTLQDSRDNWYFMSWGEGVSGWTPEQTIMMLCQDCQIKALDLNWSAARMYQGDYTKTWYVEIQLVDRTTSA